MNPSGHYSSIRASRPWDKPQKKDVESYQHQCDPQDVIDICLSCTIPGGCKPKSKECPLSEYERNRGKRMVGQELDLKVLELVKAGVGVKRIRSELHIGSRKLNAAKERLREKGEIE